MLGKVFSRFPKVANILLPSLSSVEPVVGHYSSTTKGASLQKFGEKRIDAADLPTEAVFYHPKHDMYVCWHPEVPFPYEMSKTIPMEVAATESTLKIQALEPVREIFRKKDKRLIRRELMELTYTAKYRWRGYHGKKMKYVRMDADPLKQRRDREYL